MFSQKILGLDLGTKEKIISSLRNKCSPLEDLSDEIILTIYHSSISISQSIKTTNGNDLENMISNFLSEQNISHFRQISVTGEGFLTSRRKDEISRIDFIISKKVLMGDHISNYIVLSVKKSCRERWLQDAWTFKYPPKKYLLFTLSNDYPDPILKFLEDETRKIITANPKSKDKRKFKLSPDDLVSELSSNVN